MFLSFTLDLWEIWFSDLCSIITPIGYYRLSFPNLIKLILKIMIVRAKYNLLVFLATINRINNNNLQTFICKCDFSNYTNFKSTATQQCSIILYVLDSNKESGSAPKCQYRAKDSRREVLRTFLQLSMIQKSYWINTFRSFCNFTKSNHFD